MSRRKAFVLRIPPELWEDVRRWADDELRSVNGHIEYLLREAVRERGRERTKPRGEDRGASDGDS